MFNYLLNELLLFKIDHVFVELLHFKLRTHKTNSWEIVFFQIYLDPNQSTLETMGLTQLN